MSVRKGWVFLLMLALIGCSKGGEKGKEKGLQNLPDLSGRRILIIVPHQGYRDEEFLKPDKIFKRVGMTITIASSDTTEAEGVNGHRVKPDLLLSKANAQDYDVILLIGGQGAKGYWDDPATQKLVREAVTAGKVLGATSSAPVTLARAGVLQGKKAAVLAEDASEVTKHGALVSGNSTEVDGRIVTSSGPEASRALSEAIIKLLVSP